MSDSTGIWLCVGLVTAALWLLWRYVWPDWMGAFWLGWLVLALALFVSLPVVAATWPDAAWLRANPKPPGHVVLDKLPPCDGLGWSDESPVWVPKDDMPRMVTEQLDLCALVRRGAVRSVGTREALCGQLDRLVFPMLKKQLCEVKT